ncbi:hypothetical protein [Streptomyces sp. NPDC003032]
MRHRHALTAMLLGLLTLFVVAVEGPGPLPVITESLITEGVTVEGPLVNSVAIPHLL